MEKTREILKAKGNQSLRATDMFNESNHYEGNGNAKYM